MDWWAIACRDWDSRGMVCECKHGCIVRMTCRLRRPPTPQVLRLERSSVRDADLEHLSCLAALTRLKLDRTPELFPCGLLHLASLPCLQVGLRVSVPGLHS